MTEPADPGDETQTFYIKNNITAPVFNFMLETINNAEGKN